MTRLTTCGVFVLLCAGGAVGSADAQLDGVYEFDGGGNGTSWEDAANWERVTDPNGNPISGNPATPPNATTSAEIPLSGVTVSSAGQSALDVRVGTAGGAGSLGVSAGSLAVRDLFVGNGNTGTVAVSGGQLTAGDDITVAATSPGGMTISAGAVSTADDFNVNTNGSLTVTGGTLGVGDRLIADGNATVLFDGGTTTVDDDFFLFGDAQTTVNGGTVVIADKLRFDDDPLRSGRLIINSGVVRSNEFGFEDLGGHVLRGVVEINGDGVYQVQAPSTPTDPISELTVAYAQLLIDAGGHFTTSEPSPFELVATSVIVPEFNGQTNVEFTQISLIPEPGTATAVAVALGVLVGSRRRTGATRGEARG